MTHSKLDRYKQWAACHHVAAVMQVVASTNMSLLIHTNVKINRHFLYSSTEYLREMYVPLLVISINLDYLKIIFTDIFDPNN